MQFKSTAILGAAACLITAGCAMETRTEREFGDAVRAVATSQIHDMGAAQYPSKDAVTGGSGDRIENVIKTHAATVGQSRNMNSATTAGVGTLGR